MARLWPLLLKAASGGSTTRRSAQSSGTSPGKAVLETLLTRCAPCVILIDELVAYVRQFEEGKTLTGGTFDSNLSFVQALTEALKAVPTAVLLASLPESDKEAGSQRGVKALEALAHYFGRVQALWKPVATEEAFEIVRRRLFASINDELAMESVCRAFADFYTGNRDDFPQETQESRYFERLVHAYPIHPEVFDRLYEDWSTLDNFQRTRGVLKMLAKVIHRLWKDGNNDPLIMPGSLPLYDADVRNEVIYYLPQGWDPVIERDVDGERAETTDIENKDTRFGSVQMMFDTTSSAMGQIKGGKFRPLAVTTPTRSPQLPEVPTLAEAGVRGADMSTWYALYVTAGTPAEVVTRLQGELARVLKLPDVDAKLKSLGGEVSTITPAQFADLNRQEFERFGKLIREAGIKL